MQVQLLIQKQKSMTTWTRKPQERDDQKYFFSSRFYVTRTVYDELHSDEISAIYNDVRSFAQEKNGIDYLQVYVDSTGRKLFFIDQLNEQMLKSGDYSPEHHYCTLLFANEY